MSRATAFPSGAHRRTWPVDLALLTAAALVLRAWQFGNPAIQIDEQYYLLVGDRMWHGALPYVDMWDRKPFGLFLLFALIRGLGGEGILQYQLVATACAIGTAFVVARLAARIAPRPAPVLAGMLYLACLGMSGGDGGQTPVFYNLLVAGAALAVLRLVERPAGPGRLALGGGIAMALVGVGMQLKPTCLFEGMFFGVVLLGLGVRARCGWTARAVMALMWIALALLPTVAAWGWYAGHGRQAAYDYANFQSIFGRAAEPAGRVAKRLAAMALRSAAAFLAAGFGWRILRRAGPLSPAARFLAAWAVVAVAAVLAFGTYFDHYALPLYLPLAVLAAPALVRVDAGGARRPGIALLALPVAAIVTFTTVAANRHARGAGQQQRAIAAFLAPRLHDCLFVYDGEPVLYYLTRSCIPTRWAFPDHLANGMEARAIGVDPVAEVRRILGRRPQFVVASDRAFKRANAATWNLVAARMRRAYRPVLATRVGKRIRIVFERRDAL